MGITIHYETCFRGTKNQLREKLEALAAFAKELEMQETGPIYEMNFATDFNTRDQFTPMVKNEETGKFEIDGSYRWAKIQAQPHEPWLSNQDTPQERAKKLREIKKIEKNRSKMHGFVLSLWWGEGCEATNLPFVAVNGNAIAKRRVWKGSSFTKTQYASEFVKAHMTVCAILKRAEKMGLVTDVCDEAEFYETGDVTTLIDNGEANLKMIQGMIGVLSEEFGAENIGGAGLNAGKLLQDYNIDKESEE